MSELRESPIMKRSDAGCESCDSSRFLARAKARGEGLPVRVLWKVDWAKGYCLKNMFLKDRMKAPSANLGPISGCPEF